MSTTSYTPIIGLETHAELKTKSKLFCGCKNDPFHAEKPNIHTCPLCLGMPGAAPVANQTAIEWTIKLGLALNCKINLFSKFDRKHYFYPDLAKGYQISQYDLPFCFDGYIDTSEGRVRIRRIHLEEDTAKLVHKELNGQSVSLIDFNRSSVPLIEVVTEPDIKSGTQAKEYGKKLRQILRYLDIADCDMEQGGMRLEANISLSSTGYEPENPNFELPAYKVEVKNINSFRFMESAINYELNRQTAQLVAGTTPDQETRGWDSLRNKTFSQRVKEDAADYRYMPDPDLPPFQFTAEQIEVWRNGLPELAEAKANRWQTELGIEPKLALELTEDKTIAANWELIIASCKTMKIDPNSLIKAIVNKKLIVPDSATPTEILAEYQKLVATDAIDPAELNLAIKTVLAANVEAVEKYQAGKTQVLGFLIGQVAKTLGKKVDQKILLASLIQQLST